MLTPPRDRRPDTGMIRSFLVINNLGKPRLTRFYKHESLERQQQLVRAAFKLVSKRPAGACNFVEEEAEFGKGTKVIYRQFATLFFVVVADQAESDLGILDLIQVYVEALDQIFENVCELNIVFSQPKAQTLLDELLTGGLVLDTSSAEIVNRFREVDKAMRAQDPPPGPGGSALGPGRPGMRPGPGPGRGPQVIRPPGPGMR